MTAATTALLSDNPAQQPVIYATVDPAVGRLVGEADMIWIDQQWTVVMDEEEMGFLLDRHEKNATLFRPVLRQSRIPTILPGYPGGTYDEFRQRTS